MRALLIFAIIFSFGFLAKASTIPIEEEVEVLHPYHVGSMEFSYNADTKTFEIIGRFFTDDLENAVSKRFSKNLHFYEKKDKEELAKLLDTYMREVLALRINTKQLKLNFIGFQEDRESVEVFLESEPIDSPKKVEASLMPIYNLFDDQINIIHFIVGGKRQSHKLSYPDRYVYKQF